MSDTTVAYIGCFVDGIELRALGGVVAKLTMMKPRRLKIVYVTEALLLKNGFHLSTLGIEL